MFQNYNSNCCCYYNFCDRNHCFKSFTTNYCCSNCCCCLCCPIYRQQIRKSLSKSKSPFIKMPPKMKPTTDASAVKNGAKTKRKTTKTQKVTANNTKKPVGPKDAVANISEMGSMETNGSVATDRMSNHSLTASNSFCQYQCSCKRSESGNGKQRVDLKVYIQQNSSKKSPSSIYRNFSPRPDNRLQQNCPPRALANSAQMSSSNCALRLCSPSSKSNHRDMSCPNVQPKISGHITTLPAGQSYKCCCIYCCKVSAAPTSTSSRHSFSSSKSCPPLDVINEEEPELEDLRRHCSSTENQTKQSSGCESTKLKNQKSLEDTCADFLSIVCDNILESVQKSIDKNLKELINQASEKIEGLAQKLVKDETATRDLCCEMMEKMTEKNEKNLEILYSRIQNLIENQNQMKRVVIQDKECQCQQELEEKQNVTPAVVETVGNIPEYCLNILNECGESTSSAKCGCCHCCTCCDNEEDEFDHPCSPKDIRNATPTHPCDNFRESGGGIDDSKWKTRVVKKEEINLWQLPRKFTNIDSREDLSRREIKPQEPATGGQRTLSSTTLNTFCLSPSGNKIFNCTCSTHHQEFGNEIKDDGKIDHKINIQEKNTEVQLSSPINYDNCDSSGYATEPEDPNDVIGLSRGRKRLHKGIQKVSCNSRTSGENILEVANAAEKKDQIIEKSSTDTIKRSRGNSSRGSSSSLSRLFRL